MLKFIEDSIFMYSTMCVQLIKGKTFNAEITEYSIFISYAMCCERELLELILQEKAFIV